MSNWIKLASTGLFCALFGAAAAPANAFWFGNPARTKEPPPNSVKFIYDSSQRDVEGAAGPATDLESRRLYVQYGMSFDNGFGLFGRAMPATGRLNLEGSGFNPSLWGFGLGGRWSPPEPLGPVYLGLMGAVDLSYGSQDQQGFRDKVTWVEESLAGGAALPVTDDIDVYAGLSLINTDIEFDLGGVEADVDEDDLYGGFVGLDYRPNEAWTLGSEVHFSNERSIGFMLGYNF